MPIPWTDWQFWVVTALFVGAAWYLLGGAVVRGCQRVAGKPASGGRSARATLTISAKPRPAGGHDEGKV
ncbi:MAG: hypothetical protein JNK35_11820 [Phycisphaerae bacterium]|nr:hypothetical protein [Phycisphaerae bacterium]